MRHTLAVVATMTAACWAATSQAQPAAGDKPAAEPAAAARSPGPPKPAPENEVIKKAAGTWTCAGTGKAPDGQEVKYKSTWGIKPTLGGHWYALVYKRSKMGPMPAFEGNATVGYNVADKKYVMVGFDNMGSWIDLSSNDGAVYSGEGGPMGKRSPVKFTFAAGKDKNGQDSDKLFDVTLDLGTASSTESCKK
jgi:hypothetical protein